MTERGKIERAIQALEAQRSLLGDAVIDASLTALHDQLTALDAAPTLPAGPLQSATIILAQPASATHTPLEKYQADFSELVQNAGGQLLPLQENTLVALFGPSPETAQTAEDATKLALALEKTYAAKVGERLQVGLHTAPLSTFFARQSPDLKTLQAHIEAARYILQHAQPGQVLMGHETYRHIRGVFDVVLVKPPDDSAQLNGNLYWIERAKERAFPIESYSIEGVEMALVGRANELKQLQDAFNIALNERRGQIITILGTQGVGKSRLLQEFSIWQELLVQEIWYTEAWATSELSETPYGLIRQLLCFRFEIYDYDTPDNIRAKWVRQITAIMGVEAVDKAHIIGHLLGINFPDSPHLVGLRGNAQQTRRIAFDALLQLFTSLAERDQLPIVIHIEDLHYTDNATLDLLEFLAGHCHHLPLLIIGTARPILFDRYPQWVNNPSIHRVLELSSLSEEDSRALVAELLKKVRQIPDALCDKIVYHAAGNPHHTEELVRLLIDEGILITDAQEWRLQTDRLASLHFPDTLADLVQARLYGLPADERITLQWAVIIGREFWDQAVLNLSPENQPETYDFEKVLGSLVSRNLIIRREQSHFADTTAYFFRYDLLYEITYNSLRLRHRQRLHARLAQWLIGRSLDISMQDASLIARHYSKAGEMGRAVKWFRLAASQALRSLQPELALYYYHQAFNAIPENYEDTGQQITLCESYGQVLDSQARYNEALAVYRAACHAAEKAGDHSAQARIWSAIAEVELHHDDAAQALICAKRAIEAAENAGTAGRAELARAWLRMGMAYMGQGHHPEALPWLEKGWHALSELHADQYLPKAYHLMGMVHAYLHDYATARPYFEQGLELAHHLGDLQHEGAILNRLAELDRFEGNDAASVSCLRRAVTIASRYSSVRDLITYMNDLGIALVKVGECEQAEQSLRQVLAIVGPDGWWGIVGTYRALAEALLCQSKFDEALQAAYATLHWALRHQHPWDMGVAWQILGKTSMTLRQEIEIGEEFLSASQCFKRSYTILIDHHELREVATTLRLWADLEFMQGKQVIGLQRWQVARTLYEKLGAQAIVEAMDRERPREEEE